MTTTEESQTVVNVAPATAPGQTIVPPPATPNIKRNVQLYQYGLSTATKIPPLKRFLGKKGWKEVSAIIYEDSTLKVFEDSKLRDAIFEIKLENIALYLAFGQAANKYDPPPVTEEERNFVAPNTLVAIPESKDREKVHWFAAKDERHLKDLIQAIAETVAGKINPPQLGKGQYRYSSDDLSKWTTYWTTQMTIAQQQAATKQAEENGDDPKFVATPLVAVLEQQQKAATIPATTTTETAPAPVPAPAPASAPAKNHWVKLIMPKPTPTPRQQINYYHVDFQVPEKIEALPFESDHGLLDENQDEAKTVTVRLVNGKRIKDVTVIAKKQNPESSPQPPDYPPPPVPTSAAAEHGDHQRVNGVHSETTAEVQRDQQSPKIDVLALVKEEPHLVSTKNVNIEAPLPSPEAAKREETVDLIASQQGAVVNVEHTVSTTTEYVVNGVTCVNKETTIQTNSNGAAVVH